MIDKLEMFVALAQQQHFGRAAAACNVTQPTLSSAIKALEEQLGAPLVNRGSRYMGLTPEGERALLRAHAILAESRALKADVAQVRGLLSGVLRLGVIPTVTGEARVYTAPFLRRNPGVQLQIRAMTSQEIVKAIQDFHIDAGLSYAQSDAGMGQDFGVAGLEAVKLYDEHYALLTRAGTDLPAALSWAEVAALPLGLLTPDMQNHRIIMRNFAAAGLRPSPRIEANSLLALVTHVAEAGINTILPARIASFFARQPELAAVPIQASLPATDAVPSAVAPQIALLLPPERRRNALLLAFMRHIAAYDTAER